MTEHAPEHDLHAARAACNDRRQPATDKTVAELTQIRQLSIDSSHSIEHMFFVPETHAALELASTQADYSLETTDSWYGSGLNAVQRVSEMFPQLNATRITATLHFMHARSLIYRLLSTNTDDELITAANNASELAMSTSRMFRQPEYSYDIMYNEARRQHSLFLGFLPIPQTKEALTLLRSVRHDNKNLYNREMPIYNDVRPQAVSAQHDRTARRLISQQARNPQDPGALRARIAAAQELLY